MHSVCRSISKDLRGKMRLEELVLFLVMFPRIFRVVFFSPCLIGVLQKD